MRSRRAWLIAILVGLIAIIGLRLLLSGGGSEPTEQVAEEPEISLGDVVIVRQDMDPRTIITPEMIEVQKMPAEYIHPMALTNFDDALEMISLVPLNAGEQLLQTKIADPDTNYLSYKLKEGHVAYTVPVSDLTGAAGMIRVGDEIHVLGNFGEDVAGEEISQFILYDIKVIAIGQDMGINSMAEFDSFSSMTLEVEPEHAAQLAWAQNQGSLTFILKSVLDNEDAEEVERINAEYMFGDIEPFKDKEYLDELNKVIQLREAEEKIMQFGQGDLQRIRQDLNYERFFYDDKMKNTGNNSGGGSNNDGEGDADDSVNK